MLGKHVALIGPTSYEWIISYFGVVNSQSVVVPVDAQLSRRRKSVNCWERQGQHPDL